MSLSSFFEGLGDKISGVFGSNPAPTQTTSPVLVTKTSTVPLPTHKPAYPGPVTPTTSGQGFSLGGIGDFLSDLGDTVESGVKTFFGVKSQYEQVKTAQELEKIKLAAVTSSAANAPAPAQIMLPSFSDWLSNPAEAASRVTPAALAGSGVIQTGLSSLAMIAGGGVLLWAILKK